MAEQQKPKKRPQTWLGRKLAWIMALAGADPGYRPWEEQPEETEPVDKKSSPDKN